MLILIVLFIFPVIYAFSFTDLFKILGKTVENDVLITCQGLKIGEEMVNDRGQIIKLLNVGSDKVVQVDVDGVQDTIANGTTKVVKNVELTINYVYYTDTVAEREATICTIGVTSRCIDSDGFNIYRKGTIKGFDSLDTITRKIIQSDDYCVGNKVKEFFCEHVFDLSETGTVIREGTMINETSRDCPFGCIDGACISCKDSDNGKNYNIRGEIYSEFAGSLYNSTDECFWDPSYPNGLNEYFCIDNFTRGYEFYNCPIACKNGACTSIKTEEKNLCTDSDGGKDYYTKGSCYDNLTSFASNPHYDKCRTNYPNMVNEFYCRGDGYCDNDVYTCPNGCNLTSTELYTKVINGAKITVIKSIYSDQVNSRKALLNVDGYIDWFNRSITKIINAKSIKLANLGANGVVQISVNGVIGSISGPLPSKISETLEGAPLKYQTCITGAAKLMCPILSRLTRDSVTSTPHLSQTTPL